jgi:delta1-piperideine-2-carboxylate reductase
MQQTIRFSDLSDKIAAILESAEMSAHNARIVAHVVALAERDGSHSHGLLRLPGYISTLKSGWVDGRAEPLVSDAAPAVLTADAANGFSQVALEAARGRLLEKVRAAGIAMLTINNSHHFAALWPDIEPFATQGLVALTFVHARSRILIFDAERKLLGTNPMAFACPRAGALPLVWDQASAAQTGHALPDGVGRDAQGRPTNDPHAVLAGGSIEAFGRHKGSAIALMVEILSAALTGGKFGFEHPADAPDGALTTNAGQSVIVIDPARSAGDGFARRVEALLAQVLASGVTRLPAERRYRARAKAEEQGISLSAQSQELLVELSA